MSPARKPSAAAKKRKQPVCADEAVKKRAQSPIFSGSDTDSAEEDVADVPTPRTPLLSRIPPTPRTSLLSRIRAAKSGGEKSCRRVNTVPIKEALRVGEMYDVIDIQTVNTRHGSRQAWSLKGVEDTSLKKVFSCADLDRFTVDDDGNLNQQDRSAMIKQIRLVYKGQDGEPSKYSFEFLEK